MAPSARKAENATPMSNGRPTNVITSEVGAVDTAEYWREKRARLEFTRRACRGKPSQPSTGCASHLLNANAVTAVDLEAGQLRGQEHIDAGGAVSALTSASPPHRAPGNTDFPRDLRGSVRVQGMLSDSHVDPKVPMRKKSISNKRKVNKHQTVSTHKKPCKRRGEKKKRHIEPDARREKRRKPEWRSRSNKRVYTKER